MTNEDTWLRHALKVGEFRTDPPAVLPAFWRDALLKSCRESNKTRLAISGRLLRLIEDGIVAHAEARIADLTANKDAFAFGGVVYELAATIKTVLEGRYALQHKPSRRDCAHTELELTTDAAATCADREKLNREVDCLFGAFKYAAPGSTDLAALEGQTACQNTQK